jgi:hypothetical protein
MDRPPNALETSIISGMGFRCTRSCGFVEVYSGKSSRSSLAFTSNRARQAASSLVQEERFSGSCLSTAMSAPVTLLKIREHLLETDRHAQFAHELALARQRHKLALLISYIAYEALPAEVARLEVASQRIERDLERGLPTEASMNAFCDIKDVKLVLNLRRLQNTHAQYASMQLISEMETIDYLSVLPPASLNAIRSFLSLILSPSSLPTIAKSLISQQGQAFANLGSRLKSFFLLLYEARGREVLANFAESLLVQCVQELELAQSDVSRTKETETVVIDVLDTLHSLDVSVDISSTGSTSASGQGPFQWTNPVELVLLELLQEGRRILNTEGHFSRPRAESNPRPSPARSPRGHAMSQSISSVGEGEQFLQFAHSS